MKKNILNLYEGFFDDLDKLNQDKVNDEFGDVNRGIYDEHDIILSPDKNPEFFYDLCDFCKDYYPDLPSNRNGFALKDLNQITLINSDDNCCSYFENVTSLDELKYFHNLRKINDYSFYNCRDLKSIIFPENLKKIKNNSFFNCISLEKVIFPENIQVIRKYAFCYCTSLKEITIPEKFKYNMYYIFSDVNLSKVNITYI
jgi:hypothetical protein